MVIFSPIYYNTKLLALINNLDESFIRNKFELIREDSEKQNDEFELKYIINDEKKINCDSIINALEKHGFKIYSTDNRENCDLYFDDKENSVIKSGGSIRIRQTKRNKLTIIKATVKTVKSQGSVFSDRNEIEGPLSEIKFECLKNFMIGKNLDASELVEEPIINVITQRQNTYLSRGNDMVCISMDNSKYINLINKNIAFDKMIEIENKGGAESRLVLNDVYNIISAELGIKDTNKDNKPTRALKLTSNN